MFDFFFDDLLTSAVLRKQGYSIKLLLTSFTALLLAIPLSAGVVTFGTVDCLGFNCYGASDPTSGATLSGLAPGTSSSASASFGHSYPFSPAAGVLAGTDEIHVGATQTNSHDGYSNYAGRVNGPLELALDYGYAVPPGQIVTGLTLGLALDDFQSPVFGQPFTVSINGVVNSSITSLVNGLNETGPAVQFFSFGLSPSDVNLTHTVTVSIAEGGDGGDGFAVDFATLGITTTASTTSAPEPAASALFLAGLLPLVGLLRLTHKTQSAR